MANYQKTSWKKRNMEHREGKGVMKKKKLFKKSQSSEKEDRVIYRRQYIRETASC